MRRTTGAIAAVAALATGAAWLVTNLPEAAAGQPPPAPVIWRLCPQYSDEVLTALFHDLDRARPLLARLECGTVDVPLDYADPGGRKITIGLTRLRATDTAHRLGSMAMNPGGPGGSGYSMPVALLSSGDEAAKLNERYDLIGFDPRGVGYSTPAKCPPGDARAPEPTTGPLTEDQARQLWDYQSAMNAACAGSADPALLEHLSTPDVARDLDMIRAGLGERRLSLFGVSWGTWLGTVYRSLYPSNVDRMFLDSVLPPVFDKAKLDREGAVANEREAARFIDWVAAHDDLYGFGTSAGEVRAAIMALTRAFDASPRTYTDLPTAVDGSVVALSADQPSPNWVLGAKILTELRDWTGTTAPPTLRQAIGGDPAPAPEGMPERGNMAMQRATICNDDPGRTDFATAWAAYRKSVAANPVTARTIMFTANCAGWPWAGHKFTVRPGSGSLVLSGHRYETVTPYSWAEATHDAVGGKLFTVADDVHGSAARVPECLTQLVAYFDTGRIGAGCDGVPIPEPSTTVTKVEPLRKATDQPW